MINRSALIDATVRIGHGTKVWQFASIIRGTIIGQDCNIGGCAVVDGATIGNRCLIGHGAQIHPGSYLGDAVFVGPGAIICNDRWPRVGKGGFDVTKLVEGDLVTVEIGDEASIGAGAIILPGVSIGSGAMVAAGAVAERKVPECHLLKRSGEIVPIDPSRHQRRMPAA